MKFTQIAKVGLFSILLGFSTAQADEHKDGWTGYAEGGYAHGFGGSITEGSQFLIDNVQTSRTWKVSDNTHLHTTNAFSVTDASAAAAAAFGRGANSSTYYGVRLLSAATAAGSGFIWGLNEAHVDHFFSDKFKLAVGLFRNNFGMENMWDRYAMHSYYYSATYNAAQTAGWNFETGLQFTFMDLGPGDLEVSLFNAALSGTEDSLGTAVRYHFEVDGGDWTLTPVLSTYLGQWTGGPKDIGASLGSMFKMGGIFANLEFLYMSNTPLGGGAKTNNWSLWVEPGMDLGMMNLSVKWEFTDTTTGGTSTNDMNLAAVISKSYGKFRTRLAYIHTNLGGKLGAHGNELRLLFGTDW